MDWKVVSGFLFFYCVYTLTLNGGREGVEQQPKGYYDFCIKIHKHNVQVKVGK